MEEIIQGDINNITNYIIEIRIDPIVASRFPPNFIKELIDKYPYIKISDKVRRGKKFVDYDQVALLLTNDVKQYIDNIITKEKINYTVDFPKDKMIKYFNQKLNTKYDTLSYDVTNYIDLKTK